MNFLEISSLTNSGQNSTKVAIEPRAPARASSVASQLFASPHPRSVFVSSADRGNEMRQRVERRDKLGRTKAGPIESMAEIRSQPACTFLSINRGVCVADLIKSSAAVKTCRDLEKGIPRGEFFDWARMAARASAKPLIASGDFLRYSNRLRHRSTRGVANEGMADMMHFKHQAVATRTDWIGWSRQEKMGSRMPDASTKIELTAVSTCRAVQPISIKETMLAVALVYTCSTRMGQDSISATEYVEKTAETAAAANSATGTGNPLTKAGGAYIPPARLRMMQQQIQDKNSEAYQRMNWERLKRKIHGQVNRVNVANIVDVARSLLQENLIRGRGLFARSIIQAQAFSPSFSHVFAALVAIINSKFPNIGELVLRRLIIQFKRSFRRNDKQICVIVCRFIAHLANQRVAHEIIVLEMLVLLMQRPTDDSIEVTVTLLKECGAMLLKVTPKGSIAVFERIRSVLNDCDSIQERTQYMIETILHIRKTKFEAYPIMLEELDLIDEDDQIAHLIQLNPEDGKPYDPELSINIFKFDPDYENNEAEYEEIRKEIIGSADDEEEGEGGEGGEGGEDGEEDEEKLKPAETTTGMTILDMTEQDMVAFRRNVYLTIQSSLDYQEAAHKLIKFELKPKLENELCHMIVDCCAQQRTYQRFYGLLAERFCRLRKEFQESLEQIARDTYNAIHRFDHTKLQNMAKMIAHLLATDAISWEVLSEIKLNEQDTTSSGRIYIKILFLELVETMSLVKVYQRISDPTLQTAMEGLFPRDHPKNTRFAINFFSLIGLGGLTIDLREHLQKRLDKERKKAVKREAESSSSESSSESSSSDSSSDSSSSSASSDQPKKKQKSKKKDPKKERKESKSARRGDMEQSSHKRRENDDRAQGEERVRRRGR